MKKVNQKTHRTVKVGFQVDLGISNLVQYVLDKHPYSLIPYACCQGSKKTKNRAYLALVVRDMNSLYQLVNSVFMHIDILAQLHLEAGSDGLYCVTLRWDAIHNTQLEQRAIEYNDKSGRFKRL